MERETAWWNKYLFYGEENERLRNKQNFPENDE